MRLRLFAMLIAVPALVAGLLVIAPAEAAPAHSSYVTTRIVAITTPGVAKISLACHSSKPCSGHLYFEGAGQPKSVYTIAGKTTRTMMVKFKTGSLADPYVGTDAGLYSYRSTKLYVDESGPKNVVPFYYAIRTETPVSAGRINFSINGDMTGVSNLKLDLVRVARGGGVREYPQDIDSGYISLALGTNNAASSPYILKLSAKVNGKNRSWYWHGVDGNTDGGVKSIGEASVVRATKDVFDATFYIGRMRGTTTANAEVKALGVPSTYSGVTFRNSLDSPSCANEFGADVADSGGNYSIPFLPYDGDDGAKARYMVTAKSGDLEAWRGTGATKFGSCSDVLDYSYSTANLITTPTTVNLNPEPSNSDVTVRRFYSGFKPTNSDANVRLREKIPGLTVLESPVVAEGTATQGDGRNITFKDVPLGKYWVEVGRRTGCATWYPSVYSNNSAYFKGEDRGAEAWKSFKTLKYLSSSMRRVAVAHHAGSAQNKSSGKAGWMYREYCKAYGMGTYSDQVDITATNQTIYEAANTNRKGAIVKGRVTRSGGKTNKEMLVRLSSTDGKRVIRTDVTDSGGYFYVAGLPSGNWTISVNSDSWRGIGRTFTGKHSIRVTAGRTYSAGTLRFKG